LLVADAAATRGLHLDNVGTVIVLGLPANADTYLHLAGRTGRWPRTEAPGSAVAVTIATEPELRTLRGWSAGLGGVDFRDAAEDVSAVPEGARAE
jgi:superfamily II DNA/RNA helicase